MKFLFKIYATFFLSKIPIANEIIFDLGENVLITGLNTETELIDTKAEARMSSWTYKVLSDFCCAMNANGSYSAYVCVVILWFFFCVCMRRQSHHSLLLAISRYTRWIKSYTTTFWNSKKWKYLCVWPNEQKYSFQILWNLFFKDTWSAFGNIPKNLRSIFCVPFLKENSYIFCRNFAWNFQTNFFQFGFQIFVYAEQSHVFGFENYPFQMKNKFGVYMKKKPRLTTIFSIVEFILQFSLHFF